MPKPILIAQISDLHIKAPGALAYGRVDTARALARCVAALNEFKPRPDLDVVLSTLNLTDVSLVGFSMGTGEVTRQSSSFHSSAFPATMILAS